MATRCIKVKLLSSLVLMKNAEISDYCCMVCNSREQADISTRVRVHVLKGIFVVFDFGYIVIRNGIFFKLKLGVRYEEVLLETLRIKELL